MPEHIFPVEVSQVGHYLSPGCPCEPEEVDDGVWVHGDMRQGSVLFGCLVMVLVIAIVLVLWRITWVLIG